MKRFLFVFFAIFSLFAMSASYAGFNVDVGVSAPDPTFMTATDTSTTDTAHASILDDGSGLVANIGTLAMATGDGYDDDTNACMATCIDGNRSGWRMPNTASHAMGLYANVYASPDYGAGVA